MDRANWIKLHLRQAAITNIMKLLGQKRTPRRYHEVARNIAELKGFKDYEQLKDAHYGDKHQEELDRLFNLLTGPHALTILKIWETQKNSASE